MFTLIATDLYWDCENRLFFRFVTYEKDGAKRHAQIFNLQFRLIRFLSLLSLQSRFFPDDIRFNCFFPGKLIFTSAEMAVS